jgi:carboxylesterase
MPLLPGAEPFFFHGGPTGALLIHGLSGTPREMRPLGEALAAAGHTVLGVRLPQHGTAPADLRRSRWPDWYAAVLDGYHLLREQCPVLFAMGLSMGAALALRLAAQHSLAGVVAMSTPGQPVLQRLEGRIRLAALLSYAWPLWLTNAPSADPNDPHYPRYPVSALAQSLAMVRATLSVLPAVRAPALIIHSRGDLGVPAANGQDVYDRLGSADKDLLWLARSGHVLTEDVEREQVVQRVRDFVQAHTAQPGHDAR